MLENELAEEKTSEINASPAVDLLIGITSVVDQAELRKRAETAWQPVAGAAAGKRVAIAYPANGDASSDQPVKEINGIQFTPYALPLSDPSSLPWVVAAAAQRQLALLATELKATACVFLQSDLALLQEDILPLFISAVMDKQCDVVLPVYPSRRFEGLLNHSILAPLTRALYGLRVRYPLAPDAGYSVRMLEAISSVAARGERTSSALLWPASLASVNGFDVCQVNIAQDHATQAEGLELSTVISSLVGAAFAEMETYAPQWQSVRGSQPTATWGSSLVLVSDGEPINVKPLIDSFLLGSQNLQEIWGLVLPPVTLLELRKLGRASAESFRMPDALWARIIYDFALAHRLRKINRGHLLGALTPLYLGWVASYVQEVAASSPQAAEQRLERLARTYEENKPYLISRWRWPDRFNP